VCVQAVHCKHPFKACIDVPVSILLGLLELLTGLTTERFWISMDAHEYLANDGYLDIHETP